MNENIRAAIGVEWNEISGPRLEDHEPSVGADGGVDGVVVALVSCGGNAYSFRPSGQQVVDENVLAAISVEWNEI
ncbi:MAG: hypothetical protein N3E40_06035 [Dehalococcoidia bacterium]|nr:hypothetical protein [Dehalococcoidia bacterium]